MASQMRRQGATHQTTVLHIDPIDLNVIGIFHNQSSREDGLPQNLGEGEENEATFNQILQYLMEHDPKYFIM